MRKNIDDTVTNPLLEEWTGYPKYKARVFDPILPSYTPNKDDLIKYGTITRSDHSSFWYHNHMDYKHTLPAILLTDMGKYD